MPIEAIFRDLRHGTRILWRAPALSAAIVLMIALVVGGSTAIYSVVHTLLTGPAPGVLADGLVTIAHLEGGRPAGLSHRYSDYESLAARTTAFQDVAAFRVESFAVRTPSGTDALRGAGVTPNYFSMLGVELTQGRTFTAGESDLDSSGLVAVVGDRIWRESFDRRADVVGSTLWIGDLAATIVGVAPAEFQGPWFGEASEIWVPLRAYARLSGTEPELVAEDRTAVAVIGRLGDRRTLEDAQTETHGILESRHAAAPPDTRPGAALMPYSMTAGGDSLFAQTASRFLVLFGIVTALTLVVTAANIANLMLARGRTTQRHYAIRFSVGATRAQIIRALAAEGLVLSGVAWAVGCALAWLAAQALLDALSRMNSAPLFASIDVTPDTTVLAYAFVLAMGAGLAFSIYPAWYLSKQSTTWQTRTGTAPIRSYASRVLTVLQLAFSVLLLTAAGLAFRSLTTVNGADLGFEPAGTLLVRVNTAGVTDQQGADTVILERIREQLNGTVGVTAATYVMTTPLTRGRMETVRTTPDGPPVTAFRNQVGPGFFSLMGTRLLTGREFRPSDTTGSPRVAVINGNVARDLFGDGTAVGQTIYAGDDPDPWAVIAIVPNAFYMGVRDDAVPMFVFFPELQTTRSGGPITFYVRYDGARESIVPAVRHTLTQTDDRVAIMAIDDLETALESSSGPRQLLTLLLGMFATTSLLIAAVGLYSLISFNVKQRINEFGIRRALGASTKQVEGLVLRDSLFLTGVGLATGLALSLGVANLGRALLIGVTPLDTFTYAAVSVVLAGVATLATYLPVRRASRASPLGALHSD